MILTKLLIIGVVLLAQAAGNIDGILGNAMGIIARVSYVIAFCMFIYGCVRARSDLGEAQYVADEPHNRREAGPDPGL